MADRRGGRIAVGGVDGRDDVVGSEHLQRRHPRRLRETVGVPADEQRAGGAVRGAVLDDRLRDGQDVRLVERTVQSRAAVTRCPECHLLGDVIRDQA